VGVVTKSLGWTAAALSAAVVLAGAAASDNAAECFSDDNERRLVGCSDLLASPGIDAQTKSLAYAMRALAYSLKGLYDRALPDYDEAIKLDPTSAIALNNRAWSYFKIGEPDRGLEDVDRSLAYSPGSPHAHDTRAHIQQALGYPRRALRDYEMAMRFGGERIVKLYQCGLHTHGLYSGSIDGLYSTEMRRALESCVSDVSCDPLPADEDCGKATS
jgi:tetratricopeptide (TPR) repeat protein